MATQNVTLDELLARVTKLETQFKNNQIFKTVNGENGYIAFNNGLCIQWGVCRHSINTGGNGGTNGWNGWTFPVPFLAKPFAAFAHLVLQVESSRYTEMVSINWAQTTNARLVLYQDGATYPAYTPHILAIGMVDTTKLYYNLVEHFFSSALLGVRRWLLNQ